MRASRKPPKPLPLKQAQNAARIGVAAPARARDLNPHTLASRRKSDSVTALFGRQIVEGRLQPGHLLPTEAEIGKLLDISRASVREGLRTLSAKGLSETRTRRGTIVCAKSRWDILDPEVLGWMAAAPPDPELSMMLLEMRKIIEPATARLAAQRATARQIVEIQQTCTAMTESLPDDVEACCRYDLELHQLIIAAAGNVFLSRFAVAIRAVLLGSFRISANARASFEKSLAEHWAVTDAISRRDPGEAEHAMQILLAGTERDLAPAFPQPRPPVGARRKAKVEQK